MENQREFVYEEGEEIRKWTHERFFGIEFEESEFRHPAINEGENINSRWQKSTGIAKMNLLGEMITNNLVCYDPNGNLTTPKEESSFSQ